VVGHERVVSCVGFLGIWGGGGRDTTQEGKKNLLPLSTMRLREEDDKQCHQKDTIFSSVLFLRNSE
jgi:hypothetical protein